MSDNYEFDDNDDVLLNAFGPPQSDTSLEKRLQEENERNTPVKRPKLSKSTFPEIQFSPNLNKTAEKGSPNIARRIFPGPAGILSDRNQTDICTQDTSSFFQDGPWKEMSKDFKISNSSIFDQFNIAWIKKEAASNKFANQKVPFLAGILLAVEVSEGHSQKSVNITLKDMTGTIQGTIVQNLYEEYSSSFTLGSVLVLIQFGILSCTCDKCDNHHFTVTSKNLSAIYSVKETIVIKQVDPEEVLKEYCQRKNAELLGTRRCKSNSSLFSSSSSLTGQKRLFTFKKVSNSSTPTPSDCLSSSSSNSSILNSKQIDYSNINTHESLKIGTGQLLSMKEDRVEHDKILKDILGDVDLSSLFEDDF